MIKLKITGFNVSYIQIILKNDNTFDNLAYWDRWDLFTPLESFPDKELFTFVYSTYKISLNAYFTINVYLELENKSEATIIAFCMGGKPTIQNYHKKLEQELLENIRKKADEDWVIKEVKE